MRIRLLPILLVPALALAGPFACNIITPALYVAEGPGKKEAEFTLPRLRYTDACKMAAPSLVLTTNVM